MISITTALTSVKLAADTAKQLYDLSDAIKDVELKEAIVKLRNELADVMQKVAEMKDEMTALKEENTRLRAKKDEPPPKMKWGCYTFDGDQTLYCPGCYASQGKKHPTTRVDAVHRRCTVCQVVLSG